MLPIFLDDASRTRIAGLMRSKKTRELGKPPKRPREWESGTIMDPRYGMLFTEASAWEFIAERLEAGHPVEEVVLDHPPGAKALVLLVDQPGSSDRIYIKFEDRGDFIWGRSFHISRFRT